MPNVTAFKHIVCCATIFVLLKQIQLKVIFGNVSVHDNFILSKHLSIFIVYIWFINDCEVELHEKQCLSTNCNIVY